MGRTAFLTGATGFVGGHLARHLAESGWTVRALARKTSDTALLRQLGATLVEGGLDDQAALAAGADGAEVVFHLAGATTAPSEEAFRRVNALGTRNVVRAILGAPARPRRLVNLSSYAAVGPAPDDRARRADDPPAPLTAYGRTKLEGEVEARAAESAGVELVTVRSPAVYGPGDHAFLPYFKMVRRSLAPVPAGGERTVHMVYVTDLARALARAADAPPGVYAVAEPVAHTQSGVAAAIGAALGRRPLRVPVPAAVFRLAGAAAERLGGAGVFSREKADEMLARAWVCDLAGSEALLPAAEATPLAAGAAETARWYRTQGWL